MTADDEAPPGGEAPPEPGPVSGADQVFVHLLAGVQEATGRVVHEEIPARPVGGDRYLLLATPGLATGCAAGDVIRVNEQGRFAVEVRGGYVAVHVYPPEPLEPRAIEALRHWIVPLGGVVEAPDPAKFAVATVPVTAGFNAIEDAMDAWTSVREETKWFFGNVYDAEGKPLGWWEPQQA
ncbi:MAG: DUF4265 domain-containing protein [Actinomycetota bacterium]